MHTHEHQPSPRLEAAIERAGNGDLAGASEILQPLLRAEASEPSGRAAILTAMASCHAKVGLLAQAAYLYRKAAEADPSSHGSSHLEAINRRRQEAVQEANAGLPPRSRLFTARGLKVSGVLLGLGILTGIPQEVLSVATPFSSGFYLALLLAVAGAMGGAGWHLNRRYKAALETGQARIKDLTEDFANPRYPDCPVCSLRYKGSSLIPCPYCGHLAARAEPKQKVSAPQKIERTGVVSPPPQPMPLPAQAEVPNPPAIAENEPTEVADARAYTSALLAQKGLHWQGNVMTCPDCAHHVSFSARGCPHCGAQINKAYLDRAVEAAATEVKVATANAQLAVAQAKSQKDLWVGLLYLALAVGFGIWTFAQTAMGRVEMGLEPRNRREFEAMLQYAMGKQEQAVRDELEKMRRMFEEP